MSGLVKVATLCKRTSSKGTQYLGGSLGSARVMLFENTARDGGEQTWSLCIAESPERQPSDAVDRQTGDV